MSHGCACMCVCWVGGGSWGGINFSPPLSCCSHAFEHVCVWCNRYGHKPRPLNHKMIHNGEVTLAPANSLRTVNMQNLVFVTSRDRRRSSLGESCGHLSHLCVGLSFECSICSEWEICHHGFDTLVVKGDVVMMVREIFYT